MTRKEADALGLNVKMVLDMPDVAQALENLSRVPDAGVRQELSSITAADIEKLKTFARWAPQKDWTTVIVDDNDRPIVTFTRQYWETFRGGLALFTRTQGRSGSD